MKPSRELSIFGLQLSCTCIGDKHLFSQDPFSCSIFASFAGSTNMPGHKATFPWFFSSRLILVVQSPPQHTGFTLVHRIPAAHCANISSVPSWLVHFRSWTLTGFPGFVTFIGITSKKTSGLFILYFTLFYYEWAKIKQELASTKPSVRRGDGSAKIPALSFVPRQVILKATACAAPSSQCKH